MISKNLYIKFSIRVGFIVILALFMGFSFFAKKYLLFGIGLIALVMQAVYLIKLLNETNRQIAYFFESLRNEDFTIRFPEKDVVLPLKGLYHSMNILNGIVQKVHLSNMAQEQYYKEIIKQADIGILTINDKGHILIANPTVEKLLNHSPLNHIKQLSQVDETLYALFSKLQPFDRKLFPFTNERERTQLAIKAKAITLNKEDLLLVVVQDIGEELEEKETASWVKLIRVLTHEIMNSITPITSISASILSYFKKNERVIAIEELEENQLINVVKGLEVVKEQGNGLMSFVESYRTLLSVPKPDKEIVSVKELLDKVKVLSKQQKGADTVVINCEIEPNDLTVFMDRKQLMQVLLNLVKNAIQAIKPEVNGIIILKAGVTDANKKYISIIDNGGGITPEQMEEIFIPFFTTKTTGTGIGLSLSKQILQLHGGSLKVQSIPNKETVFTLVLE